nr:12629_t:CDS:2 [Entrophospora candida]
MIILIKTKKGWSWGDRSGGDGKIGKYGLFYNNNTGTGTYDPSFDRTWGRFRRDIDKVFDDFFSGGVIGGRDREGYGGAVDVKDTENKVIVHEIQIPTGSNLRLETIWFVHPSNNVLTINFDICAFYPGSVKYKCMQQGTRISDYFKKDEPPANETRVHSHILTPCSSSLRRTNN